MAAGLKRDELGEKKTLQPANPCNCMTAQGSRYTNVCVCIHLQHPKHKQSNIKPVVRDTPSLSTPMHFNPVIFSYVLHQVAFAAKGSDSLQLHTMLTLLCKHSHTGIRSQALCLCNYNFVIFIIYLTFFPFSSPQFLHSSLSGNQSCSNDFADLNAASEPKKHFFVLTVV